MRKILSLMMVLFFTVGMAMANVGNVYYTATFLKGTSANGDNISGYAKTGDYTTNGIKWTIPGNNTNGDYIRIGGNSITSVARVIASQAAIGDAIAKIVISHNGISRDAVVVDSVILTVASDAAFSANVEKKIIVAPTVTKSTAGTIEFLADGSWATNSYYKFSFYITNTTNSNGGIDVQSIAFYSYQDASMPYITAENVDFGTLVTQDGSYYDSKTVDIAGGNLKEAISYSIIGSNVTANGTLTATGGSLTVIFSARAEGEYSDTIVFISGGLTQKMAVSATVVKVSGFGTQAFPFTVADVVKLNNRLPLSEKYWVQGYIVGCAQNYGVVTSTISPSNIALGNTADQEENAVPVELPNNSEVRTALNLQDHPGYVGTQVKVYGQLIAYFLTAGVKAVDDYEIIEEVDLEAGYYLVGNFNDWTPDANYMLAENEGAEVLEYMIDTAFNQYDSLKVVQVNAGNVTTWYPDQGDNYVVPAAGEYTIYFRPGGNDSQDWHYGYIYAAAQSVTPVEPEVAFYLNNNWNGVQEWLEKEMVYDESTTAYYLNGVVFGGTGVDLIKKENGKQVEKKWYPIEKIDGREITGAPMELMALDTVDFFFSVVDGDTSLVAMITGPVARPVAWNYYLVGDFNRWDAKADYALLENDAAAGEYMIENVAIKKGNLKVYGTDGTNEAWYPADNIGGVENTSYQITEDGTYSVYFRPDGKGNSDWHYGYFYVALVSQSQTGCDWSSLEWLGGPADYANQFKVCKADGEKPSVVNIQNPAWTDKTQMGIYMTFPSAAFGNISLDEAMYEKQGAGILFFLSAFTAKETEVTVVCDNTPIVFTVYNDKGIEDVPDVKFYIKNNWKGGENWYEEEMTYNADGEQYLLEEAVFGGTGVNIIKKENGKEVLNRWYPVEKIVSFDVDDHALSLMPLDTATFIFILMQNKETGGVDTGMYAMITGPVARPVEPEYYLVGNNLSKWEPKAEYKLAENTAATAGGEYMIENVKLAVDDSLKVVKVVDGAIVEWYPADKPNLVVGIAGTYDIYFRPDYQGGSDWYQGCIYLTNPIVEMAKVYVVNRLGWEVVYAYVFNSTTGNELETWPGVLLRQLAGAQVPARYAKEQVYEYEFPSNYDKIIFNNGKEDQEAAQTVDLTWKKEEPYYLLEGEKNTDGKYEGKWSKTPTDIDNIDVETTAIKVLQNGQIFIIKAGHIYNLTGQIVK